MIINNNTTNELTEGLLGVCRNDPILGKLIVINNDKTTTKLTRGLLDVWTNNPRIIASSIYNNSVAFSEFLNTKVIKKVNNIFLTTIEEFVTSIEAIKSFVTPKALEIKKSFSSYFFETPKVDLCAVYRKAHGRTKEELRILTNFKKINTLSESENQVALEKIIEPDIFECTTFRRTQSLPNIAMHFSKDYSLDQMLEIGDKNNTLPLPLSPEVLENPMNIARIKRFCSEQDSTKELQEPESLLKELEELTLNEVPESTIIQKIIQRNKQKTETINRRLKKFSTPQISLTPLSDHPEVALKKDLDGCRINWFEKSFAKPSIVLQLDPVELLASIQQTKELIENLLKDKRIESKSKILMKDFQLNLNKLQHLITEKQLLPPHGEKLTTITTLYQNYIKSHKNFLKKATNHQSKGIEGYVRKQSPKLTKCLAEIEYNLC